MGMVLSANLHPSDLRVATRTTPIAPLPRGSPRMSASSASRRRPRLKGSPARTRSRPSIGELKLGSVAMQRVSGIAERPRRAMRLDRGPERAGE